MSLSRYILRRALQLVPVLFGITVVVFLLIHLVPGDPARTMLGYRASPADVARLHHAWGLDHPLPEQYGDFLGRLARLDFGDSLFYDQPVRSLIGSDIGVTVLLLLCTTVLAVLITLPLALAAAARPGSWIDHVVRAIPLIGLGMPSFWLGTLLITFVAVQTGAFPAGGYGAGVSGHLKSMVLPSLTLALALAPILVRSLRASLIEVLRADFVATARSKGVSWWRLMTRHVLRNALIPVITVLGLNLGALVGGTVVVERVFGLPGLGSLMVQAISTRDFPIVQALTLVFAVMVVIINLATDIAYSVLDRRVRLG